MAWKQIVTMGNSALKVKYKWVPTDTKDVSKLIIMFAYKGVMETSKHGIFLVRNGRVIKECTPECRRFRQYVKMLRINPKRLRAKNIDNLLKRYSVPASLQQVISRYPDPFFMCKVYDTLHKENISDDIITKTFEDGYEYRNLRLIFDIDSGRVHYGKRELWGRLSATNKIKLLGHLDAGKMFNDFKYIQEASPDALQSIPFHGTIFELSLELSDSRKALEAQKLLALFEYSDSVVKMHNRLNSNLIGTGLSVKLFDCGMDVLNTSTEIDNLGSKIHKSTIIDMIYSVLDPAPEENRAILCLYDVNRPIALLNVYDRRHDQAHPYWEFYCFFRGETNGKWISHSTILKESLKCDQSQD